MLQIHGKTSRSHRFSLTPTHLNYQLGPPKAFPGLQGVRSSRMRVSLHGVGGAAAGPEPGVRAQVPRQPTAQRELANGALSCATDAAKASCARPRGTVGLPKGLLDDRTNAQDARVAPDAGRGCPTKRKTRAKDGRHGLIARALLLLSLVVRGRCG